MAEESILTCILHGFGGEPGAEHGCGENPADGRGGDRGLFAKIPADGERGAEITYLMIKPPAMSGLTSLGSGRETQITLRVTQMDTGELLVAESKTITLHSIYDFTMLNSEFGVIEPYNLLAWLRPDAEEVLALRREAIYWLGNQRWRGLQFPARLSARLSGRYRRAIYHRTAGHGHTRCDQRYWRAL